jgi:hypothetical protein
LNLDPFKQHPQRYAIINTSLVLAVTPSFWGLLPLGLALMKFLTSSFLELAIAYLAANYIPTNVIAPLKAPKA